MKEPPSLLEVVLAGAAVFGILYVIDKATGGKVRRELERSLAERTFAQTPPYKTPSSPEVTVTERDVIQAPDPDADEGDPDDPMN